MGNAIKYRHISAPIHPSEKARIKIVQGPDHGTVFVITGTKATIGRGEENDICLSDLKASRLHADFFLKKYAWFVKDLGSANGILHNGKNTTISELKSHDSITLGETVLEFFTPDAGRAILESPSRDAVLIQREQSFFESRQLEVKSLAGKFQGKSSSVIKKSIIFGIAAVIVVYLVLFEPAPPKQKIKKTSEPEFTRDLAAYLPSIGPSELEHTAEIFFKSGFREYREKIIYEQKLNLKQHYKLL
ncbi:MAG: FHA domain-containing protein, partial [Deltaproteobacteria bacterium]|nr:FHA domain-containing protein [Deltaproteobacteria bacterium]